MKNFSEYVRERDALKEELGVSDALGGTVGRAILAPMSAAYWGAKGLGKGVMNTLSGVGYGLQRGFTKPDTAFYNMPDEKIYWAKKQFASTLKGVEEGNRREFIKWICQTYSGK